MYYEAPVMIANALKHSVIGVNAMIESLNLESGVQGPPMVRDIVNETEHPEVANRLDPQNTPALYVMVDAPLLMDGGDPMQLKQNIQDLPVSIRYVTREVDSVRVRVEAMYTIRAVVKTLTRLNRNEYLALRQRNQITLEAIKDIAVLEIQEDVGDAVSVIGLVVNWTACNRDP